VVDALLKCSEFPPSPGIAWPPVWPEGWKISESEIHWAGVTRRHRRPSGGSGMSRPRADVDAALVGSEVIEIDGGAALSRTGVA